MHVHIIKLYGISDVVIPVTPRNAPFPSNLNQSQLGIFDHKVPRPTYTYILQSPRLPASLSPPTRSPTSYHFPVHPSTSYAIGLLRSSSGMRIYASIAAENTAKPAHPTATACGPAFLARIPPVIHPPATPL